MKDTMNDSPDFYQPLIADAARIFNSPLDCDVDHVDGVVVFTYKSKVVRYDPLVGTYTCEGSVYDLNTQKLIKP